VSEDLDHEGLALLLQASRDFALKQLAQGRRLVPFAARVQASGDIDFVRFVAEDTELPLDAIHRDTRSAISAQAQSEGLLAAAIVAAVGGGDGELGEGFKTAVRVDIEAPGYSRIVLSPYRLEESADGPGQLVLGELVTYGAEPAIFPH
jgi:hypothetical protein